MTGTGRWMAQKRGKLDGTLYFSPLAYRFLLRFWLE
jgi:hypothetical protein